MVFISVKLWINTCTCEKKVRAMIHINLGLQKEQLIW